MCEPPTVIGGFFRDFEEVKYTLFQPTFLIEQKN